MKRFNLCSGLGLFFILAASVFAAVPKLINFQGILRDGSGNPVPNGSYSVTFRIYDAPTGGNVLWSETQTLAPNGGFFNTLLGSINPVPDSTFKDSARYLGIMVASDPEMSPRFQLVSVGYAYRVNSVDGALGGVIRSDVNIAGRANIGFGNTVTGGAAFVAGIDNIASGLYSTIGGGDSNNVSGQEATIGGGEYNVASAPGATIAGGRYNRTNGYGTTVGGGLGNTSNTQYATVAGGWANTAGNEFTTIAGGRDNSAYGYIAAVGGGQYDTAGGSWSTVSGGLQNTSSANWSTIGGGNYNIVSESLATIGGGGHNRASQYAATVGGGLEDSAGGAYSTIGGGIGNKSLATASTASGGWGNIASGNFSSVVGGYFNKARGLLSVVAGGGGNYTPNDSNAAIGDWSVIPGGRANWAAGSYSFAAGRRAKANQAGVFVWADSTDADFASTGENQFLIRASGGVGIGTNAPQGALDVSSTSGAFIVPRMTTAQRDALVAVNGMIIYNITTNQFNFYENGNWVTK